MDKKKGFSFLEMLIVIMVISILFVAFRSSFQVKNKDVLYGQTCIETLYGQVNNFFHAGLSSKSISSGTIAIFPDQYIISFKPLSGAILLSYIKDTIEYSYSNIELSGDTTDYCVSNSYAIVMTGGDYILQISKGSLENLNYSNTSISTGRNTFLQCDTSGTGCKEIARFESDIRTLNIKKQICLTFTGAGECLERDN